MHRGECDQRRVPPNPIRAGSTTLSFVRPIIMGVINVTPDSFSDGGRCLDLDSAVAHGLRLVEEGATIIDIGGESTRPGALHVATETELKRTVPVVRALAERNIPAAISIDTGKAEVARAALAAGATIVNDVTALSDPEMATCVAEADAALIVMHMRGEPRTMQEGDMHYDDLLSEVRDHLAHAIARAKSAGVSEQQMMVDPGLGFGKTTEHNLTLTLRLDLLGELGRPIVYGPSRKRFLGEITGRKVDDRDPATAAVCVAAVIAGAHVLRVHNVAGVRDALAIATALRDAP